MPTTPVIRSRLLTTVLLGAVTSALSLVALVRVLSMTTAQRTERARDAVRDELGRLRALPPSATSLAGPPGTTYVGIRGGWVHAPAEATANEALPSAWRAPVADAIAAAGDTVVVHESPLSGGVLLAAAVRGVDGTYAWTAYLLPPSMYMRPWRWITFGLAAATALLVATAVSAVLAFRRSAAGLQGALERLGKDLTAPVPTPDVVELRGIAARIRHLAIELLDSREATERLGGELAAKERLAALGRVVAGVAHEVRNPLTSIKLRLDLAAATQALPDSVREAIASATAEIARLDRLVSDLLLVAGKRPGPRRALALGALARARAEALGPWAATRRVSIAVEGEATVEADSDAVARAIDNLLRNAVEASPEGATVLARVSVEEQGAFLSIEDSGAGVGAEREAELFEPFFTTKADGTGLGLAISRAIARGHGGDLTYAREAARTRFTLRLPREAAEGVSA